MGVKSVSSLQYNENDLDQSDVKVVACEKDRTFQVASIKKEPDKTTGLRQRSRIGVQDIQQSFQDMQFDAGKQENQSSECHHRGKKNPINWFGVLVPQSLKQSQAKFKKVTQLVCNLATLKARYVDLQNNYRELLNQKQKLLNDIPAADNVN